MIAELNNVSSEQPDLDSGAKSIKTPEELVSGVNDLISLPEIYLRVREIIDKPTSSITDVAGVVSQDPNISARILKIANSAFFGFATKIDNVTRAITIMGLSQLHDLVLATSVVKSFKGIPNNLINMSEFWLNSVYCGVISRLLAGKCNVLDSERLFVTGVVHDIGHLIIYMKLPEEANALITRAKQEHRPLSQLEREIMGFDYAQVGGALLNSWKLPASYIEPVQCHTDLGLASDFLLESSIIHLASVLAAEEQSKKTGLAVPAFNPLAWQATGLSEEDIIDLKYEAAKSMAEVLRLFFKQ